ncbi:MAG: right-handed parallel beta-helix repeat-containing protein [Lentisphaerae bacterium]|jgi:hypothetical protein|nr:right-handed parallel beta-helix repeat-containing protein [Lentisphaerota bacterium]MBT4816648.1 right-handed parallel beta-helix repeat-containing protein [Lentisphaerota bacterium]MBT5610067.1 right-handed parallel beta-helix repeat-containing protein [Lentisphaerota bacterium]MBT7055533.1 right-handed parallel beta-helix repeat-containing protein [Lentisphaerota bacterium]MBT7841512.1 right-handed parallel beta-helix repeat-containing protein [Lentisphaerota bacterium]
MRTVLHGAQIDVTESGDLQEAVRTLPPEGGAIHVPAGTYEIDRTVLCELAEGQHLHLYGDGRASVLVFTGKDGSPFFSVRGVENSWWPDLRVTFRDLSFVGNHASGDALFLRWPNDMLIDSCFFHGFGGTAIRVTPNASNVCVRDCWMRDCRRALHADNLHHLTFRGNQTRSMKDGLVQDEQIYIGRHCREVRLVDNHLAYGHAEAIILDGTAQHAVCNNMIEGFQTGIAAVDCRDITICANYIHCPQGILLTGDTRGFVVSGNIFTNNSEGALMVTESLGSGGHVLTGNVVRQSVYNDGQRGFDLGDAVACVVRDNVFEDLDDGLAVRATRSWLGGEQGNIVSDTLAHAAGECDVDPDVALEPGSAYQPLFEYLESVDSDVGRLTLTSWELRRIVGEAIPAEAWEEPGWWANTAETPQGRAWLSAGWLIVIAKRIEGRVVLARTHSDMG